MKKNYLDPDVVIVRLEATDVIVTSGCGGTDEPGEQLVPSF